jgi:hypothetical protein
MAKSPKAELVTADTEFKPLEKDIKIRWLILARITPARHLHYTVGKPCADLALFSTGSIWSFRLNCLVGRLFGYSEVADCSCEKMCWFSTFRTHRP